MERERSRYLINRYVILGAFLIAFLMCSCLMLIILYPQDTSRSTVSKTAIMDVIRAPTTTAKLPSSEANPSGSTSTPQDLPTLLPGEIGPGMLVQVQETGGDGLRLRDKPGLEGQVLMLGNEAEVFAVVDGPQEIDGYTWWYLVGYYDETRYGWGVSDYLKILENP